MIEHLELIQILHLIYLLLQLIVLKFIIEATSSWSSSWVSWRLALPFDGLDNFSCFLVNFSEWVHSTTFASWMENSISSFAKTTLSWNSSATCSSSWRTHNLMLASMIHLRLFIDSGGHVQTWWWSSHDNLIVKLMLAHICRVLFSSRFCLHITFLISSRSYHGRVFHSVLIGCINTSTSCVWRHNWTNVVSSWYSTYSALPALLSPSILSLSWLDARVAFSHSRIVLCVVCVFHNWLDWQSVDCFYGLAIKLSISGIDL